MAENEKLDCLRKLQDVLQEKFTLEQQVETLPRELRKEEAVLRSMEKDFSDLRTLAEETADEVKSLRSTQREYEALSKQLEDARANEETLLKQRNSKTKEAEKLAKDVEAKQAEVEAQKAKVDEERAKVDSELSGINEKIAALDAQCLSIKGSSISNELYEKFSNIVRKKDGTGIVPVHGQVCMGCDRVLPMQFVIDLRLKQEKNEIDYCPYCSRILWYEPLDPETEKSYIFEQLESKGTGDSKAASSHDSQQDSDSYDESMGMDGGFEDF